MIAVRRAKDRYHVQHRRQEAWHTFYKSDRDNPFANGFGSLEIFTENSLPPGAGIPPDPQHDAEILTYVRKGALAHEDSTGCSGVISTGEFQHMTAGHGIRHRERNPSRDEWAQVFQIWFRPTQAGREPNREQKRFSAADRRGMFCVVGSPDARTGSLRLQEDVLIYSALLEAGQHVIHELPSGRSAWLHVVSGEAALAEVIVATGDGVGISGERAVSLTARESTELLLVDLEESKPIHSTMEGCHEPIRT